jgi:hypothetical protein
MERLRKRIGTEESSKKRSRLTTGCSQLLTVVADPIVRLSTEIEAPSFWCYSGIKELLIGERETMAQIMEKDEAHKLIDRMPANATWDDLMQEIYVREAIEKGLLDSKEGRTTDVREIRAKYGLPE